MIVPDVNVLIACSRSDHPHYRPARSWLEGALSEHETKGGIEILPIVAASFLRLVTHPKVLVEPTPLKEAARFLDALLDHPGVDMTDVGASTWRACQRLCLDKNLTGNAVPDAFIAAAARMLGGRVATFDRDFTSLLPRNELLVLTPETG